MKKTKLPSLLYVPCDIKKKTSKLLQFKWKNQENGQKIQDQWRGIKTNVHCLTSLFLQFNVSIRQVIALWSNKCAHIYNFSIVFRIIKEGLQI